MTGKSKEERKDKKRRIIMGHHRTIPKTSDYGVTKDEFFTILEKASQPIKKPESDSGKAQT